MVPLLLSLVLLQQPQIAKVEVQPSGGEVPIGGKMKFTARPLDASGQVVPGAEIGWFVGGGVGDVDSAREVPGGYQRHPRGTAGGGFPPAAGRQGVRPGPPPLDAPATAPVGAQPPPPPP